LATGGVLACGGGVFGVPIRQAIERSLVAVNTTSAASSLVHPQRHTTDIRLGMTLKLATAFGAAVMAYLVGYFNRNVLEDLFVGGRVPLEIECAGVLLMLVTPVVRVLVACVLFFRENDRKYGLVSLGVLVILLLGSVFGIGEH